MEKVILQFEPLNTNFSILSCKMSYTPFINFKKPFYCFTIS